MVSAAKFTGEGRFFVGDDEYVITLNNMALLQAESKLGESMLDFLPLLMTQLQHKRNPQVRHITALIYGGLKVNHPFIDEEFVVDLCVAKHEGLLEALVEAMSGIEVPNDPTDPEGNVSARAQKAREKTKKKGGIGTGSTKRGAKAGTKGKTSS